MNNRPIKSLSPSASWLDSESPDSVPLEMARPRSYIAGVALLLSPLLGTHEKLALWCTLAIAALRELSWKETGSSRPELQSETHLNNKETREAELWLLPGP